VIHSKDQPRDDEPTAVDDAERAPLGQMLVESELLTQAQLDDALYEGSRTGERLGEVVVRRGLVSEDDVARLLAEQWGLEYVERSAIWFDPEALALLSREDAQRLEALPTRIEGGHVVVAVAEPTDQRLGALREVIGHDTVVIVVPKSALDAGLRSQLLASRVDSPDNSQPARGADESPAEEAPPPPPRLTAVSAPSAEMNGLSAEESADAVVALAAEARAVAERLATQAAAVRAQAQEQNELRRQAEEYEARISALEHELADRQGRLDLVQGKLDLAQSKLDAARGDLHGLIERLG
jgi:hypothetical protein